MAKPIFPPIFLQRMPNSHQEAVAQYIAQYDAGIASKTYVPFTYPSATLGAALLLTFLLIPPTNVLHSRFTRYATFVVSTWWHVWLIRNCKSFNPAVGFGVGLICAWGVLWSAVVLVFHDSKVKFDRLVRNDLLEDWASISTSRETAAESSSALSTGAEFTNKPGDDADIHQRKHSNNSESTIPNGVANETSKIANTRPARPSYAWQSYPLHPFNQRIDYVMDLITNFRGIGWSWKVPGLPSYPSHVTAALSPLASQQSSIPTESAKPTSFDITDHPVSRNGLHRFDSYYSLIVHNAWVVTKGYILMDLLVTIMNHDPYFWGLVSSPPPAYYPFTLVRSSWFLTRCYRLLISMSAIWIALRTVFAFAPLFYVGVLSIYPGIQNVFVNSKAEPWLYPDTFGAYLNVLDRGLAGWWGGWWHQTFRFAFSAGGTWACRVFRIKDTKHNKQAMVVKAVMAFALSGWLHAAASVTQMGETRPMTGSFLFFIVQPIGIFAEMAFKDWLKRKQTKIPRWAGRIGNFMWVHAWFFVTAPLLTDDFARGGIWLFEPVMISLFRGLGFGPKMDGWYCWDMFGSVRWAWSERWWMSGIAF